MKKIVIFIIVFVVALFLAGSVWWFFTKNDLATTGDGTQQGTQTFNPFGLFGDITPIRPSATSTDGQTPDTGVQQKKFLTAISEKVVAGSTFAIITHGTSTDMLVRYVERETGHIFDYSLSTGLTTRISNTTVPRVREALWGNNASTVALRYLTEDGSIETFLGTIATSSANLDNGSLLSGSFLPKDIVSLSIHPTLPKTFYLTKTNAGGVGYVLSEKITKSVFLHPFSQWQTSWSGASSVLLTTAPSSQSNGNAFLLNTTTKTFDRIASSTTALTAHPSPDGLRVLFGSVGQAGMRLFIYDVMKKQRTALSFSTLPEKCAWVGAGTLYCAIPDIQIQTGLPDVWYQGVVSFSDELWKIDTQTGNATFIFDPHDTISGGADMIDIGVSAGGGFLSFTNKKDGRLWLVDFSAQPVE
ncbi:MAG: hypothetical protein NUW02_01105 [Candidatus Campbellbacteria bacterium]|nr:hypothetical protein [Candidatus Campbellbacteria bacterium]